MAEELGLGMRELILALGYRLWLSAPHAALICSWPKPRLAPPMQGASRPAPGRSRLLLDAATSALEPEAQLQTYVRAGRKTNPNYHRARIRRFPLLWPQRSWLCHGLTYLWDPHSLNTSAQTLTFPEPQLPQKCDLVIATGLLAICSSAIPVAAPQPPTPCPWCSSGISVPCLWVS